MSDDPAYGFAIGRVRSLEGTLLGHSQYDRLLRAAGPTEFVVALQDLGYGRFFDGSGGSASVDMALDAALSEYATFLAQYALDHWLLRVFQLPIDILNLKSAVKALRVGAHASAFLSGGLWSRDDLAAAVAGDPARLGPGVDVALAPLVGSESASDATSIDTALDRLEHKLTLSAVQPSCFLSAFYRLRADLENARTVARIKASSDRTMRMLDLLLDGGIIGTAQWSAAMDGGWDDFPRAVAKSGIEHVVEQGVARFTSTGSLLHWEKVSREAELVFLRGSRYAIFGHEPLATFHYFRLNELRNLRGINAAHRNRLSPDIAQELVAYVD